MKRFLISIFCVGLMAPAHIFAQKTCTSNPFPITADINFANIVWVATDGATVAECNAMADGLITFEGDVRIDVSNNTKVTITNNVNIDGNFPISGGPGSTLSVNGGFKLYVTGDLGDATSNGVQYEVVTATDEIRVDGTLYGKNDNAFSGEGKISGGTLNVKNGTTCPTPPANCPVRGGFESCTAGDSFCTTNGVTLPITLLFFEANASESGESVQLKWGTTMEEDFDKFIIQRSDNGKDFQDIYELDGQGHDLYNITSLYKFTDEAPLVGFNYYRLKALDLDATFEYFKIIAVKLEGAKKIVVYPNPTSGSNINFRTNFTADDQTDRVVVLDALGNEVFNLPASSYNNSIQPDAPLKAGVYILKYTSKDFESVTRLVIKD